MPGRRIARRGRSGLKGRRRWGGGRRSRRTAEVIYMELSLSQHRIGAGPAARKGLMQRNGAGVAATANGGRHDCDHALGNLSPSSPTTAVVIVTHNYAHYLGEAIQSVVGQTRAVDEIIVVDDGSQDDPAAVVRRFEGVRLLRQRNQGLSAARNAGMSAASSEMVVFLDADDRLLPDAIALGLACHARSGECSLVYGGHRHISAAGLPLGGAVYKEIGSDPYRALLEFNVIGMCGAVMYRRDLLLAIGGFDVALPRSEDYDVYLRLARCSKLASYPDTVAEYRRHDTNMSLDYRAMLRAALLVQARNAVELADPALKCARKVGRARLRAYYAREILLSWRTRPTRFVILPLTLMQAFRASPSYLVGAALRRLLRRLPSPIAARLRQLHSGKPPVGRVRFGDLDRTYPIDDNFGYGRGTPVDRLYIESFLEANRADIAGHVLEVGDDHYSRRFGTHIITQDVLHLVSGNPRATITGDLADASVLPKEAFDCIVLTQTLQFVFNLPGAVKTLYDALRPGGVLLATLPGISRFLDHGGEWGSKWYWALSAAGASCLFAEHFPGSELRVESYGNVYAATAFLQGLALEELPEPKLRQQDAAYPIVVTVRARK